MSRTDSVDVAAPKRGGWNPPKRWCYRRIRQETRGALFFYFSPASKRLRHRLERVGKRVPFSIRW